MDNFQIKLAEKIRDFANKRDWQPFHNPKNLAMAITGEAGELAAEFQWLTPEESFLEALSPEDLKAISLEIADVQIYLLRLADQLKIDLKKVVEEKLVINEKRFPEVNK